jgi:demethylmenaquinone methyltransferase/2-methoxy-6-polyprenyl-1,4-benzoquinol methylase
MDDPILADQMRYYRERGPRSYDDWFYRRGRYDHGAAINRQWFRELIEVIQAMTEFDVRGNVIEFAGGTGIWTERLVATADSVTSVDCSPDGLEAARIRLGPFASRVRLIEADIFDWTPRERFDCAFFGFWLSHVPATHFARFWQLVATSLNPGGRVFFVDSLRAENSMAKDTGLQDYGDSRQRRRLDDGREFTIYKVYYSPKTLGDSLAAMGWSFDLHATREYFIYGSCKPPAE